MWEKCVQQFRLHTFLVLIYEHHHGLNMDYLHAEAITEKKVLLKPAVGFA